ncbi:hypothetical protein ACP70R_041849 [Stipagrostis hirtigluma subsp. patula]
MLATKRSGGDLTRSSDESKRTRSLVSGGLSWYTKHGVWSGLGKEDAMSFSKSVVSIALSDVVPVQLLPFSIHNKALPSLIEYYSPGQPNKGSSWLTVYFVNLICTKHVFDCETRWDTILFSSSGIAIQYTRDGTRFLTSASLVRVLNNNKSKNHDDLKIEVRYEGKVVTGFLEDYDLHLEVAFIKIKSSLDVDRVFLYHWCRFMPYCNVVSLGRDISGKLMAITGNLILDSSGSRDTEHLMFSSCKLSEVWEGGPIFSITGEFVGMNLVPGMKKSFFLPVSLIIERLQHFSTSKERDKFLARVEDLKRVRVGQKLEDGTQYSPPEGAPNKDLLEVLGYPRPTSSGMTLVNTFEEHFGDVYRSGVWKQLDKGVRRKIRRSVVSLASFSGDSRFFACSGIFIHWDGKCGDNGCHTILTSACLVRNPDYPYDGEAEIVEGLRIKVLLPSKKQIEGTLIHYNLHYNVALVGIQKICGVAHAIFKNSLDRSKLVAAVGRCYKSSDLMASSGKLVPWSGPFDCKKLRYSTCRITKAGIGGPLVDYDGNFIGMNFYDQKVGTPYLFCDDIVDIMDCFKSRSGAEIDSFRIDGDHSVSPNEWPVPLAYWRHPDDPDSITDHEREILASGRQIKYCNGTIRICK